MASAADYDELKAIIRAAVQEWCDEHEEYETKVATTTHKGATTVGVVFLPTE